MPGLTNEVFRVHVYGIRHLRQRWQALTHADAYSDAAKRLW
jgi:hypothetical protein